MTRKFVLTLAPQRPRNPFGATVRRTGAGAHRDNRARQREHRALRDEVSRLEHERHQT